MSAIYRQRISDDRLIAVVECVRSWLFPSEAENYFKQFRAKAEAIHAAWEEAAKIAFTDVQAMLNQLGIKQYELARGIGYNAKWVNAIVKGRAPLSPATQMRLRAFVEQLAQGQVPTPVEAKQSSSDEIKLPHFDKPADVPLSEEVRASLTTVPLTRAELNILVAWLSAHGITQTTLAKWWGCKFKFYCQMRYGERPIPPRFAYRLCEVFGLRPPPPIVKVLPTALGKIPASNAIAEIFARDHFGREEIRHVLLYLRREYGFYAPKVAGWLQMTPSRLWGLVRGQGKLKSNLRSAFRAIFAFDGDAAAEKGGAQ